MNLNMPKNQHSLGSVLERQHRLEKLHQAHIQPLSQYLADIRAQHPEKNIPHFDPNDGGVNAKALFLMLAVGPKTMGSPFLSVDNTDGTATNFRELLSNAKISRNEVLFWNIIPWYASRDSEGKREIKEREIVQGFEYFESLLTLLPRLKVIVLLGKQTHFYKGKIQQLKNLPIIETSHPTPTVFNCHLKVKEQTQMQFLEVARYINR